MKEILGQNSRRPPQEPTTDKQDIPFLSVAELGKLLRQREVSPVEATPAYLDHRDSLNFKFNSCLTRTIAKLLSAATV